MATNREVIDAALEMLGVYDPTEASSSEDASVGLRELNRLMASMVADGIDLGWPTQDNVSDEFPLDETNQSMIESVLAMRLYKFFPSANVPPSLPEEARDAMAKLTRTAVLANMEESSLEHLPRGSGFAGTWDITSDN